MSSFLVEYSKILKEANNTLKRNADDSYLETLRLKADNARMKSEIADLIKLNTDTIKQYTDELTKIESTNKMLRKQLLERINPDPK